MWCPIVNQRRHACHQSFDMFLMASTSTDGACVSPVPLLTALEAGARLCTTAACPKAPAAPARGTQCAPAACSACIGAGGCPVARLATLEALARLAAATGRRSRSTAAVCTIGTPSTMLAASCRNRRRLVWAVPCPVALLAAAEAASSAAGPRPRAACSLAQQVASMALIALVVWRPLSGLRGEACAAAAVARGAARHAVGWALAGG